MGSDTCCVRLLAGCAALVTLVGCGGADVVAPADLPGRLAGAIRPLERAGFDVDPVTAGPDEFPILIVKEGDQAVVLAVADGIGRPNAPPVVPLSVADSSGQAFDIGTQTICGPDEFIAATVGANAMSKRVTSLAGFC
jgi:hypothetical protein